jgi:prophage regulatory protein
MNATKHKQTISLPIDGFSRQRQVLQFFPASRETWRKLVLEGRAPQPIHISPRFTAYSNAELHKFFADPLSYRAEVAK